LKGELQRRVGVAVLISVAVCMVMMMTLMAVHWGRLH
jgi:hypothetical protein